MNTTLTREQLSLGLEFVYKVINTSSYDEKLALLESERHGADPLPYEQLTPENDEHVEDHDDECLDESFDDNLAKYDPRAKALIDKNLDKGPKEAWQEAHFSVPWAGWVMFGSNAGRRKRAYVLWDLERNLSYGLSRIFEDLSRDEESRLEVTEEEREQMERSWSERSKIWVRGGRGYWAEGDLSRIEWPASHYDGDECTSD